jgi:hypothetical protein
MIGMLFVLNNLHHRLQIYKFMPTKKIVYTHNELTYYET